MGGEYIVILLQNEIVILVIVSLEIIKIYSVETSNIWRGLARVGYYLFGLNKFDIRHRHVQ